MATKQRFNIAIDFGSYYVDGIEAETKEQAREIALKKFEEDSKFKHEISNIDIEYSEVMK